MTNAVLKKSACSTPKMELGTKRSNSTCASKNDAAMCTVPTCEIRIEECRDGCKICCTCEDEAACATIQDLCRNLSDRSCEIECSQNGQACCKCCFTCCDCTCQMLSDGVCIYCKASDKACLKMVQEMCRCLSCCQDCGCESTVCIGGTPVCCSGC